MDELTAYRILEIEPGSSREAVKEAYAMLSKKFHPEEHPEKFQEIHEAYVTLTRGKRRRVSTQEAPEMTERAEEENPFDFSRAREQEESISGFAQRREEESPSGFAQRQEQEESPSGFTQRRGPEEEKEDYDFEQTLEHAEEQEKEKLHEVTLQAIAEIRLLTGPDYRNKVNLFRTFFKKEVYYDALRTPEFLYELTNLLAETNLKKQIYDFIISYYKLRAVERDQLIPEAQALYDVLEQKRGIQKGAAGTKQFVIPVAAVIAFRILRTGLRRTSEGTQLLLMLLVCAALFFVCRWIYKKLYEKHSGLFSQFIVALLLFVSHFLAVGFDIYAPLMGSRDAGATFASLVVAGSLVWLAALPVAAVVLKIKNGRK